MEKIAHIRTDFPTKFGIPRQSGLVETLTGKIIFEPKFRNERVVAGLEEYSHIWIIWHFSENANSKWSATVRPPRLGGKVRKGVFATRSPFRPNGLGLSSVHLDRIENDSALGPILYVSGIDMMDGTPIFDIKPYVPFSDCHSDATGGFAAQQLDYALTVSCPDDVRKKITEEEWPAVEGILAQDPRPAFHDDPKRVYGISFKGMDIHFKVEANVLTIIDVK